MRTAAGGEHESEWEGVHVTGSHTAAVDCVTEVGSYM